MKKTLVCIGLLNCLILCGISCQSNFPFININYLKGINSSDPAIRVKSIAKAAKLKDFRAIPLLIDRLEDEDAAVRLAANEALKYITGKDFGYRDFDPPAKKKEAIHRWREWEKSRQFKLDILNNTKNTKKAKKIKKDGKS